MKDINFFYLTAGTIFERNAGLFVALATQYKRRDKNRTILVNVPNDKYDHDQYNHKSWKWSSEIDHVCD